MRLAVLLAAALGVAGCGGGGNENGTDTAVKGALGAELERPGPDVALVQGTADYAVDDSYGLTPRFRLAVTAQAGSVAPGGSRHSCWICRTCFFMPVKASTIRGSKWRPACVVT